MFKHVSLSELSYSFLFSLALAAVVSLLVTSVCAADILVRQWNWNWGVFLWVLSVAFVVFFIVDTILTSHDNFREMMEDNE